MISYTCNNKIILLYSCLLSVKKLSQLISYGKILGWYAPTIESRNQGMVQEGSSVQISCIGNTLNQSTIHLVNSLDVVVEPRVIVDSFIRFTVIFDNIGRNASEVYRCRETINGRYKYSSAVLLNVSCK